MVSVLYVPRFELISFYRFFERPRIRSVLARPVVSLLLRPSLSLSSLYLKRTYGYTYKYTRSYILIRFNIITGAIVRRRPFLLIFESQLKRRFTAKRSSPAGGYCSQFGERPSHYGRTRYAFRSTKRKRRI